MSILKFNNKKFGYNKFDYLYIEDTLKENEISNKLNDKIYYNHSGYTGGLRERTAKEMRENYPVEMIERAVKGMIPDTTIGRKALTRLRVYKDAQHNHAAQQPEIWPGEIR